MLMMAALTILSFTVAAQNKTAHKTKVNAVASAKYVCPMHPGVTSDKPGKCTQCGMDLVKAKKEKSAPMAMKMYACSMHPEITSDKPGKCSKCGMDLSEVASNHGSKKH